jgi:hypothetical protein
MFRRLNKTGAKLSPQGAAATLAEFNLPGYLNQSFYDISLVDGYNLPLAIQVIPNGKAAPSANTTNPSCVGSVQNLASVGFNPYSASSKTDQTFLGTSSSNPLPFDNTVTSKTVATWCPPDLQTSPVNGGTEHAPFDPCLSACAKYNKAEYCCTGKHNTAKKCGPNYYSKMAKSICPDAYSYAYDDKSSTFAVPMGAGFEIIFCPGGRSTIIQKTLGKTSGAAGPVAGSKQLFVATLFAILVSGTW